jgi:cell division protein FtsW (lipid II flippase)
MASEAESPPQAALDQPRAGEEPVFVEARWPVALAVGTFIAITIALRIAVPNRESLGSPWIVPGIEIGLLACLILADPAHVAGRRRWLRRIAIALVLGLACAALVSTGILIRELIVGGKVTNEAGSLLASGALIWLGNVLVFSLIYWLLDSGGPLAPLPR